ncbi:MAG: peptidylprolyl isomerase [Verrucomicrobia bacterium]|nr:peptidylprolyl isomerase [Verrucomicrobiota bacterium]
MPRLSAALAAAFVFASSLGSLPASVELPDVCAKVDGESITKADVLRAFDAVILSSGQLPSALDDEAKREGYKVVLDGLINDRLIARAAKDIVVTEAEVNARLNEIKKKYEQAPDGSQSAFLETLAKTGMTESGLRENLAASIRQGKWMQDRIEPLLKVEEAEIKKAYEENKATFTNPEVVRASHILFRVDPGAKPEEIAEKQKKADATVQKLVASKGADFAKHARELSEDEGTRAQGGDLGWFAAGSGEVALEKTIFSMKVGDISAPVRSKLGFHIVLKTGQRPPEVIPLDKVRERIRQLLLTQNRKAAIERLMGEMRSRAKIEVLFPPK